MKKVIRNVRGIIWVLAVFVLLGMYSEVQAACGTDTVSKDGLTYGTVTGVDGRCWLDRNLGATRVATSVNDTQSYGWLFQWGRGVDGHQISTSTTATTLSATDTPGHANFILSGASFYDWRATKNDNLWQGLNGINNPCPTGFRVPTQSEWSAWVTSASLTGVNPNTFASSLKLPYAGWREGSNGVLTSGASSTSGRYWSSTLWAFTYSYAITFQSASATNVADYESRARAFSVRCIQDVAIPAVSTSSASSITGTTATGNGNLANTNGENPTRSIEWGTTSGNNYSNSCLAGTGGTGAYSCAMTGLAPSTTYYVRAKATNSAGTSYGEETTFTTSAFICGTDTVTRNSITYGTVMGADGNCWLDRNLGATRVATAYNDSAAYGWYFQWGRSDDGHQISSSSTTTILSATDTPGHSSFIKMATPAPSIIDWRSPQNNNLWQGVSGINNPCPAGWRLPTQIEWATEVTAAGITNYTTAFNSSLKLTAAGYRYSSNAGFQYQGMFGYYWSGSRYSTGAFNLFFHSGGVDSARTDVRANSFSVRCLKDVPLINTPTVTTQAASAINTIAAVGNGNITATGGENPIRSIEWGTTQGSNYTNSCSAGTGGTGVYSCDMTNLTPGTTYYARATATNSAGTSHGDEVSFTTPQAKATVTTSPTTNILTTSVTGNATITDIGGENPTREIQWGTQAGIYTNSCSAGAGATGTYSCQLTSLTPGTTYYLRAMATNSAGTSYGEETSFTTLPSQVTISEPDTTKMNTTISSNYVSLDSGNITSTPQITTNTNIIFQDGIVSMDIPTNTQITKTESGNFNFQNFITESATSIVKQTVPNSISAVKVGVVGTKISFSQPITLTIDVDSGYNGRTLDVLYQNDGETDWHSQTSCTITAGKCIFTTNHATTYTVNGSGNMAGETGINLNTDIQEVIALDCGATSINLGNITPGTPITGSSTCTATTNANGGYNLSVRRDDATSTLKKNTENSITISDLTPWDPTAPNADTWSGNGLGFTVFHSTANKNSAWWGAGTTLTDSNNKYAGFNTTQSDIMRNSTYVSSSTATDIGYMLSVPPTQKSGAYSGAITYQATTTP